MMNKKGMTLIEVLVASTVFMILISLVVGSFISFSNMKSLSTKMRNSQEKLRVALDMISRNSRQASDVNIITTNGEKRLVLMNTDTDGNIETGSQFIIEAPDANGLSNLYYLECSSTACNNFSTLSKTTGQNLLGGDIKLIYATSGFSRSFAVSSSPYLDIILNGSNGSSSNNYYNDNFSIETGVVIGESY
jgi:type II secretory pathway pseudopilin PulG